MSLLDELASGTYKDSANKWIKLMNVLRSRFEHLVYGHLHELSLLATGSHIVRGCSRDWEFTELPAVNVC